MPFVVGETVKLKSGGAIMAVREINRAGDALCVWFEGSEHREKIFPEADLMHFKPSQRIATVYRSR
jgi:uncharacterized protein YodC (DUF2158 family)